MSHFVFNPITREYKNANPRDVQIPGNAYNLNAPPVLAIPPKRTSPVLVAIMITVIILLILALIYLFWVIFIKAEDESPTSIFQWLIPN